MISLLFRIIFLVFFNVIPLIDLESLSSDLRDKVSGPLTLETIIMQPILGQDPQNPVNLF